MMAPLTIIDYIVVHELAHLIHPNHTAAFWNQVDKVMPDFQERKEWLRNNGSGQIWLDPSFTGDEEIGPIPVPAKVARGCKVGWDIGGVVAQTKKGWRLVEVWNISP